MPDMISKVAHQYGDRKLAPGDRFVADPEFVPVLVALGRAEIIDARPKPAAYHARDMDPGPPAEYQTCDMAAGLPARLQRRDLAAGKRKARKGA